MGNECISSQSKRIFLANLMIRHQQKNYIEASGETVLPQLSWTDSFSGHRYCLRFTSESLIGHRYLPCLDGQLILRHLFVFLPLLLLNHFPTFAESLSPIEPIFHYLLDSPTSGYFPASSAHQPLPSLHVISVGLRDTCPLPTSAGIPIAGESPTSDCFSASFAQ